MDEKMKKIVSLAKRRGFIFQSSEIYGGLANAWDYGPLGVELKNNIKQRWWKRFVHQRADVVGIDAALLMNPKVWEASGHMKTFDDQFVECSVCKKRWRTDALREIESLNDDGSYKCPTIMNVSRVKGGKDEYCPGKLSQPRQFNLMLKTFLGPTEDATNVAYFRPETAQAMFVDFKNILDTTHRQLPFGIAQTGKAFRNEITPGNFIFRTREFEQMEIEYFVKEEEWEKYFEYWLNEMKQWLKDLGISEKKLHYVDIPDEERAHYSKRTVDIEYDFPFGQKELYGLAYRGDFDLKNHFKESPYKDAKTGKALYPHVIEPTWGVERSVLAAMLEAYHEEDVPTAEKGETATRVVMKFPNWLAPVKIAILPLSKKEELANVARPLFEKLSKEFVCEYDEVQSIGKRYRRQDEIGTPYCVTVDFDTLKDNAITLRDRDTMEQKRIPINQLADEINNQLNS